MTKACDAQLDATLVMEFSNISERIKKNYIKKINAKYA